MIIVAVIAFHKLIAVRTPEKIVGKFRQLPGAKKTLAVDHERRQDLGVPMVADV